MVNGTDENHKIRITWNHNDSYELDRKPDNAKFQRLPSAHNLLQLKSGNKSKLFMINFLVKKVRLFVNSLDCTEEPYLIKGRLYQIAFSLGEVFELSEIADSISQRYSE